MSKEEIYNSVMAKIDAANEMLDEKYGFTLGKNYHRDRERIRAWWRKMHESERANGIVRKVSDAVPRAIRLMEEQERIERELEEARKRLEEEKHNL